MHVRIFSDCAKERKELSLIGCVFQPQVYAQRTTVQRAFVPLARGSVRGALSVFTLVG